jgi:3-(methylthio)propanoyl-CoA dehydrogenase
VRGKPLASWPGEIRGRWDPRQDFSFALLHAERLTRIFADVEIARVLLGQSRQHPERGELVDRYLARAEPRVRSLHDEITSSGGAFLDTLLQGTAGTSAA